MAAPITPPRTEQILAPLLASLPGATIASSPPPALLPILSPILRQRVQILSSASQDPWLPLLCYNSEHDSKLESVVKNDAFEPHPVSGEVELDWDAVRLRYKRVDEETLQCLVAIPDIQLSVKLIWCVNDEMGGGDGWRIGEVSVLDDGEENWGHSSILDAEKTFVVPTPGHLSTYNRTNGTNSLLTPEAEEDDDDDYWAQYDNTPARTPGPQDHSSRPILPTGNGDIQMDDDASYYAQYATVQPALDNHDPDEAQQNGEVESSLGKDEVTHSLHQHLSTHPELHNTSAAWSQPGEEGADNYATLQRAEGLAHPRPGSSTGSSGSETVAKLEKRVAAHAEREQSETGIKQHIGTSVKSLYRLAKVAGIDRAEFERIVRTELDCLGLMDQDDN